MSLWFRSHTAVVAAAAAAAAAAATADDDTAEARGNDSLVDPLARRKQVGTADIVGKGVGGWDRRF